MNNVTHYTTQSRCYCHTADRVFSNLAPVLSQRYLRKTQNRHTDYTQKHPNASPPYAKKTPISPSHSYTKKTLT